MARLYKFYLAELRRFLSFLLPVSVILSLKMQEIHLLFTI